MSPLRLLADENFPRVAVDHLVELGHDVVWVRTAAPGMADPDVLALARAEGRTLLTFDRDFTQMAFRDGVGNPAGILFFRLTPRSPQYVKVRVAEAIAAKSDWRGWFATVRDDRVIARPLPAIEG